MANDPYKIDSLSTIFSQLAMVPPDSPQFRALMQAAASVIAPALPIFGMHSSEIAQDLTVGEKDRALLLGPITIVPGSTLTITPGGEVRILA